jgi:hypothetical protein
MVVHGKSNDLKIIVLRHMTRTDVFYYLFITVHGKTADLAALLGITGPSLRFSFLFSNNA